MPSLTFTIGTGTGTRGGFTVIPITVLSTGTTSLADIQWTFNYSGDIASSAVTLGSTAIAGSKAISTSSDGKSYLIFGVSTDTIADGTLAIATFSISLVPFDQVIPIPVGGTGVVAADVNGTSISVAVTTGFISIFSPTSVKTLQGHSRIKTVVPQTITGKASIQVVTNVVTTKTLLAKSRLIKSTTQTIPAKASIINVVTTRTILAKSRIQLVTPKTILGKASIAAVAPNTVSTQTIVAKSRITTVTTQTIQGLASINNGTTQTITGQARITVSGSASVIVLAEQIFTAL